MTPFPPHLTVPTYAPPNYQPGQKHADSPAPTERQMEAARRRNASHIHNDGSRCYMWRFGEFNYADWSDTSLDYGSWKPVKGDYPAGEVVEL